MNKLKELLRLKFEAGLTHRQIAQCLSVSPGSVSSYTKAFAQKGFEWPLDDALSDDALASLLKPLPLGRACKSKTLPDFAKLHTELKQPGVTLQLLWEEYQCEFGPKAYSYSQYCHRYQRWRKQLKRSMRQVHRAGEKCFIDYCGPTLSITCPDTGEVKSAQVFVAVMGASNYTYAEATWSQRLPDWLGSHVRLLQFLGGVPELLVPDNLKSAVSKACRYDPDLNPTYQCFADHYGVAVMPARPYKPKDKAKAENGVLIVERWIMAKLRKRTFFTLSEANTAIRELLDELNRRPFKKLPGSRLSQFEELDKPALKPLPKTAYEYTEIKRAKVHIDYHVEVAKAFYSVPHALVGQSVDIHIGANTVAIYHKGQRVASHPRSQSAGHCTTEATHMPTTHQKHHQWTPSRFKRWANDVGPNALEFISHLLKQYQHPEHAYRACLGVLNLARTFGNNRLDAACLRAVRLGTYRLRSIKSILKKGLDKLPLEAEPSSSTQPTHHQNLRGANYFH